MTITQPTAQAALENVLANVKNHEARFHGGRPCATYRQEWLSSLAIELGLNQDELRKVADDLAIFAEHREAWRKSGGFGPID